VIGKRTGYGKDLMAPHSLTMSMIGASLLWVGLVRIFKRRIEISKPPGGAALAHDQLLRRYRSGGAVLDVRGVDDQGSPFGARRHFGRGWRDLWRSRPAAGLRRSDGERSCSGLIGRPWSACFFVTVVKNSLGYDDSLDVFGGSLHRVESSAQLGTGHPGQSGARAAPASWDYTTGKVGELRVSPRR